MLCVAAAIYIAGLVQYLVHECAADFGTLGSCPVGCVYFVARDVPVLFLRRLFMWYWSYVLLLRSILR